jgi:hypothetical protein
MCGRGGDDIYPAHWIDILNSSNILCCDMVKYCMEQACVKAGLLLKK